MPWSHRGGSERRRVNGQIVFPFHLAPDLLLLPVGEHEDEFRWLARTIPSPSVSAVSVCPSAARQTFHRDRIRSRWQAWLEHSTPPVQHSCDHQLSPCHSTALIVLLQSTLLGCGFLFTPYRFITCSNSGFAGHEFHNIFRRRNIFLRYPPSLESDSEQRVEFECLLYVDRLVRHMHRGTHSMSELVLDQPGFWHADRVVSGSLHGMVFLAQRMKIAEPCQTALKRIQMEEWLNMVDFLLLS